MCLANSCNELMYKEIAAEHQYTCIYMLIFELFSSH